MALNFHFLMFVPVTPYTLLKHITHTHYLYTLLIHITHTLFSYKRSMIPKNHINLMIFRILFETAVGILLFYQSAQCFVYQ